MLASALASTLAWLVIDPVVLLMVKGVLRGGGSVELVVNLSL